MSSPKNSNKKVSAPETLSRVLYSKQCRQFSDNSMERCALCLNHPGEHSFPVTGERDTAIAALREVADFQMSPILAAEGYQQALKQLCQLKRKARVVIAAQDARPATPKDSNRNQWIDELYAEIERVKQQRDAYEAALRRIATFEARDYMPQSQDIASTALAGEKEARQ